MKKEIKIPAMGESINEATIGKILKPNGSSVALDDEILELETDKVNQALYAPQKGTMTLTIKEGDTVTIGQVIGYIEEREGEKTSPSKEEKLTSLEPSPLKEEKIQSPPRHTKEEFIKELSFPPREKQTQEKSSQKKEFIPLNSENKRETRRKMSKIRKAIASRLVEAQQTTAMLTTFNEVDLSKVIEIRNNYQEKFQKDHQVKLGLMSFFVKATISALAIFPNLNSYIEGDEIVQREYFDIGIAVATDRGLVVPVVRNCERLSFAEIEKAIETFAKKAREGSLSLEDLQGGGFTITNGGIYGSLLSTPILNPPQSGILGMHKIEKRPIVVDDQIVIRSMTYLALSYDHRLIDGKEAVSFLVHIKNCLEDPSRLLLEV